MKWARAVPLALLVTGCATPKPEPEPAPVETPASLPQEAPPLVRMESQPLKHLLGRHLKPIPDKPLEVRTKCSFRDVAGGRGTMDLQVTHAEVKRFVAQVTIPKQGICRFEMASFQQTASLPNVVLTDGSCVVSMWEQDRGLTVAFNACQAKCSGDAFSYLWPILVDTRSGRCS
jgi:hypothetical protein